MHVITRSYFRYLMVAPTLFFHFTLARLALLHIFPCDPFICCTLGSWVVHLNCHWHSTSRVRQTEWHRNTHTELCVLLCHFFVTFFDALYQWLLFIWWQLRGLQYAFPLSSSCKQLQSWPPCMLSIWHKLCNTLKILCCCNDELVYILFIPESAKKREASRQSRSNNYHGHGTIKVKRKSDLPQCILISFHEVWQTSTQYNKSLQPYKTVITRMQQELLAWLTNIFSVKQAFQDRCCLFSSLTAALARVKAQGDIKMCSFSTAFRQEKAHGYYNYQWR